MDIHNGVRAKPAGFPMPGPAVDALREKQKPFGMEFFLCAFSFSMLLVSSAVGMWSIVAFLAPWSVIFARRPGQVLHGFQKNWPLFLMPLLAILSFIWSREPSWTAKAGLELAATVMVGIMAGHCIKPRVLISSLLAALGLIAIVCVLYDVSQGILATVRSGGPAMMGFYASKNAFSAIMSMLMLTSVAVLLDKGQRRIFRLLSIAAIVFTPLLLIYGRSVGAIIATYATLMAVFAIRFIARYPMKIRLALYVFVFMITALGAVGLAIAEQNPMAVLDFVGKDSTLTGRTQLWARASDFIDENTLLGMGYRAFWRAGFPPAEELWYASFVPSGSGFNFHNEYIEMWVELGLIGLMLMVGYFAVIAKRVIGTSSWKDRSEKNFALIIFTVQMLRSPVEVSIFDMFNIANVLLCVIWIYFRPSYQDKTSNKPLFKNALPYKQ